MTYYSTPTYTKKYKTLIIIGFDLEENKPKLVSIILLENENIETFYTIFKFLNNNYKFIPKFVTIDFSKALYIILFLKFLKNNYNTMLLSLLSKFN